MTTSQPVPAPVDGTGTDQPCRVVRREAAAGRVTYHGRVLQPDGSIRIAWHADGFEAIVVRARFRARPELETFARAVADVALLERSLPDLRTALRLRYPGAFDLLVDEPTANPGRVIVSFHPPPGEPNPDPW